MEGPTTNKLTAWQRRRAMQLSYLNAGLWAIGNGLTSTTLIVYLALDLGALGISVSLILATPRLIGVLRLTAPALAERMGDRRKFCIAMYLGSTLLLMMLPLLSAPGLLSSATASLTALVVLWSAYHLLEYCGTVALWSWLGDLVPTRIRGRFIGRRERWLTLGRILGMLVTGLFAWWWREWSPQDLRWAGYAIPAGLGATLMMVALVPLDKMPSVKTSAPKPFRFPLGKLMWGITGIALAVSISSMVGASILVGLVVSLVATLALLMIAPTSWSEVSPPFFDRRFSRLMLFGVWFSSVNGITQAAQGIYPYRVLNLHLLWMLLLPMMMRLGQSGLSPWVGRLSDRIGNRPVMIVSQLLVALGPLFYLFATPEMPGWIIGAWILWIAYVGLNVCLPGLMLKLAPGEDASPYVAAWFALTGLFHGISTIAGGLLFDMLGESEFVLELGPWNLDRFGILFLLGTAGRLMGVVFLLRLIEPGARRLKDLRQEYP